MEHLLRDINDPSTSVLALQIKQKVKSLATLAEKLQFIQTYLSNVINDKLPLNHNILYNIQNIISLLPNLNIEDLVRSLLVKTNDFNLVIYLASLIRSVMALHDLLNNKIKYIDVDEVLDRNAGMQSS